MRVLKINCSDDDDDNRNSAYLTSDGGRYAKVVKLDGYLPLQKYVDIQSNGIDHD